MARRNNNPNLQSLKNMLAYEMGIELGADQTSRNNGRVGGQMVKTLIKLGEQKLNEIVEEHQQATNVTRPLGLPNNIHQPLMLPIIQQQNEVETVKYLQ